MAYTQRQLANDLYHICRERDSAVCLYSAESDVSITYADLLSCITWLSPMLSKTFPDKKKILTILPNSIEQLLVYLSCLYSGLDFMPINPSVSLAELGSLIERHSECVVITDSRQSPEISHFLESDSISVYILDSKSLETWKREYSARNPLPPKNHRCSNLLISTSGSTGEPKTISISADRLWSSAINFSEAYTISPASVFWNFLPMHYLGGIYNLCLIPISAGASVIITPAFSGSTVLGFWQFVERLRITHLWLVPSILKAINKLSQNSLKSTRHSRVQAAFIGTAHIDPVEKEIFSRTYGIPIYENYGLTETTFVSMVTPSDDYIPQGSYYKGKLCNDVSVRLGNSGSITDTDGNVVYPILVKSPYMMNGYISGEGRVDKATSEDGYYDTGDLGWIDGNHLYISSRKREIIKKGGILINLCEVEKIVSSVNGLSECVAVPIIHDFYGESFFLCILSDKETVPKVDSSDRNAPIYQALARGKWPEKVYYVQQFPVTVSGKIDKPAIARHFGHVYASSIL